MSASLASDDGLGMEVKGDEATATASPMDVRNNAQHQRGSRSSGPARSQESALTEWVATYTSQRPAGNSSAAQEDPPSFPISSILTFDDMDELIQTAYDWYMTRNQLASVPIEKRPEPPKHLMGGDPRRDWLARLAREKRDSWFRTTPRNLDLTQIQDKVQQQDLQVINMVYKFLRILNANGIDLREKAYDPYGNPFSPPEPDEPEEDEPAPPPALERYLELNFRCSMYHEYDHEIKGDWHWEYNLFKKDPARAKELFPEYTSLTDIDEKHKELVRQNRREHEELCAERDLAKQECLDAGLGLRWPPEDHLEIDNANTADPAEHVEDWLAETQEGKDDDLSLLHSRTPPLLSRYLSLKIRCDTCQECHSDIKDNWHAEAHFFETEPVRAKELFPEVTSLKDIDKKYEELLRQNQREYEELCAEQDLVKQECLDAGLGLCWPPEDHLEIDNANTEDHLEIDNANTADPAEHVEDWLAETRVSEDDTPSFPEMRGSEDSGNIETIFAAGSEDQGEIKASPSPGNDDGCSEDTLQSSSAHKGTDPTRTSVLRAVYRLSRRLSRR